MKRRGALLWMCLALTLGLLLAANVVVAFGFAEEELGFKDQDGTYYPSSGDFPENRISTVHDDLTLALAIAAGFTISDSHRLRVWDQLVDSEVLPSAPVSYTYGNAGFYAPPNPALACLGKNRARQIWPTGQFDADRSAVTSRFGPYSPFFHFPHLGGADLQALHDWSWGFTNTLKGYEAYAWGRATDFTLMQAVQNDGCLITHTVTISMPVTSGSLAAFSTYLHSLADAYSHEDCLLALAAAMPRPPWGTHTVPILGDTSIYACDYNPSHPQNEDAHGREFGGTYTDTGRTIAAARAVYSELAARGWQREGVYRALPLTTTLTVSGTTTSLDGAMIHFVTGWDYPAPVHRREYMEKLLEALLAQPRQPISRLFLPLVRRQ